MEELDILGVFQGVDGAFKVLTYASYEDLDSVDVVWIAYDYPEAITESYGVDKEVLL